MYFLVVIVSKAAIARRRAIASFCDSNSLLNHLSETAAILSNESSYMASTTRNSVVKNDGINQLVVIYLFTSIPYTSAASRRLTFSFTISKIRMIPPFLRKNGGLPDLGQAAVCVSYYAVFVSFSFLASRKAFFRAPCRLICAAYRQSSLQYFTSDLVVINSLPQFSQVHARLRLSAASCR